MKYMSMAIFTFPFLTFGDWKPPKTSSFSNIWFENSLFGENWPQSLKMATESFVQPFVATAPAAAAAAASSWAPAPPPRCWASQCPLKLGLFHLNLSLFFFLFVFSACSHILTSCLLSLQIGFHVCMLAGCMWVVFSVWRTRRMPDASYNSTNKQTKTV